MLIDKALKLDTVGMKSAGLPLSLHGPVQFYSVEEERMEGWRDDKGEMDKNSNIFAIQCTLIRNKLNAQYVICATRAPSRKINQDMQVACDDGICSLHCEKNATADENLTCVPR